MATTPLPDNSGDDNNNNKLAISMAILVVLIIIVVAWFTNRMRPFVVTPASVRNLLRREEERYQKEIGRSLLLESLPVVRYSTRLQPNNSARTTYPPRRQLSSKINEEKPRVIHTEAAVIARASECKAEPIVNTDTPDDKRRKPPQEDTLQNEGQSGSPLDPANCSVCTENFAENESVRILPCGHIYHQQCIDPWLLDFRGTCPLCRKPLQKVLLSPPSLPEPPRPARLSRQWHV